MLVFNLHASNTLINILAYIALMMEIKDSLIIYMDRAVQKYIKLLLYSWITVVIATLQDTNVGKIK